MARVRIIGPRERLPATLELLQDFGRLQVDRVPAEVGMHPVRRDSRADREQRALRRLADDSAAALNLLGVAASPTRSVVVGREQLARWARRARRLRRDAERAQAKESALREERVLLGRYRDFLEAFGALMAELAGAPHLRAYGVTLPARERGRIDSLAEALRTELGAEVVVLWRALPSGDLAVLIAVPPETRERMERAFGAAKIAEVPLPTGYTGETLSETGPRILARLDHIPRLLDDLERERASTASTVADELQTMLATAQDRLSSAAVTALSVETPHAFAVEGWLPRADVPDLQSRIDATLGGNVVVEELSRGEWQPGDAPVVLSNPPIFRPFEMITSLLPLPVYGSIDPTPFLAVGFPMLFGIMLGDVGYGAVLALIALLLLWRAPRPSLARTLAQIGLACSVFSLIFGLLFGEFFGSLGQQWFGFHPWFFDREHSIVAAMVAAIGIGVAHTVLGLVLGMIAARRTPKVAASRAVQLVMMLLIGLALLSAVHVLPNRLFGPFAVTVFLGFPILVLLEGIVAPVEFLSTISSVLSYVRIMALGTASVMLAAVANDMSGLFGSALVGVLFGLLFHLVNFAMGLFSPTIHALRLHYVEFFKQFYSPGGRKYEPFSHRGAPPPRTIRGSI